MHILLPCARASVACSLAAVWSVDGLKCSQQNNRSLAPLVGHSGEFEAQLSGSRCPETSIYHGMPTGSTTPASRIVACLSGRIPATRGTVRLQKHSDSNLHRSYFSYSDFLMLPKIAPHRYWPFYVGLGFPIGTIEIRRRRSNRTCLDTKSTCKAATDFRRNTRSGCLHRSV